MDWVHRPKNYKGLYEILQLLQGSHLGPVVQRLDNTIHWINHYPVDKC